MQPSDHLDDQSDSTLESPDSRFQITIQPPQDLQLGPELLSGTAGIDKEPPELGESPSATGFRYVGRDGKRCANQLIAPAVGARSSYPLGEPGDFGCDLRCKLVDQQPTNMSTDDHLQV